MNQRTHNAMKNGPTTASARNILGFSFGLLGVLSLLSASTRPALAQTPPEAPKEEPFNRQSLINPYAKDKGNEQNRGRGSADVYWGITDANKSYKRPVYSRSPDITLAQSTTGLLELDGWGFPRGAYQGGVYKLTPSIIVPQTLVEQAGGVLPGSPFVPVAGPSTFYRFAGQAGGVYLRAPAQVRPNTPAQLYAPANRYRWDLGTATAINIRGAVAGQQFRFQVRPILPTPPDPQPDPPENRISDARYTVYYYIRVGNHVPAPEQGLYHLAVGRRRTSSAEYGRSARVLPVLQQPDKH